MNCFGLSKSGTIVPIDSWSLVLRPIEYFSPGDIRA